jgi:hypothetical protein
LEPPQGGFLLPIDEQVVSLYHGVFDKRGTMTKINSRNSPLFAQGKAKWDAFVATYTGPYGLQDSVYAGMNRKVSFVCPTHGVQAMDAKNLMAGKSCNLCAIAARAGKRRMTQQKMLTRFTQTHGGKYNYEQAIYKGQQTPVSIVCPEHGSFLQKPEFHWNGSGCPKCFHIYRRGASQRDTLESFTAKVQSFFGGLFEFPGLAYTNNQADIIAHCTKHDLPCPTRPNWLLNGYNPCPKCNHMKSSGEEAVSRFLSIFTPVVQRDRTLIRPKELDIYLPEHKLAIEYCGEFWHSSGSKEEEAAQRRKHIDKHKACAAAGIRLLTIYESEWLEHSLAIKRLLRNAVGKSKGKLMARKCKVREVSHSAARDFYDDYHPQGGEGNGVHYGLFWKGSLVACMRFTFGANDRGKTKRAWTLTRYATRVTVAGGASRLFQAFVREHTPAEVKSFSDNRFFNGGMYKALGFTLEEELGPDYMVWSPKNGLWSKNHYQRRLIPKRLVGHGVEDTFDPKTDPRTEAEMTYLMGCRRIYDCGKKRWVWRLDTPKQAC